MARCSNEHREILKTVMNPSELLNWMTPKWTPGEGIYRNQTVLVLTARSVEDETRNAELKVIEILNGGEILVNCKFKLNKNVNLNLYRKIPRNSNPIKISIRLCTVRYREI